MMQKLEPRTVGFTKIGHVEKVIILETKTAILFQRRCSEKIFPGFCVRGDFILELHSPKFTNVFLHYYCFFV